jgi:hypothetical protein
VIAIEYDRGTPESTEVGAEANNIPIILMMILELYSGSLRVDFKYLRNESRLISKCLQLISP